MSKPIHNPLTDGDPTRYTWIKEFLSVFLVIALVLAGVIGYVSLAYYFTRSEQKPDAVLQERGYVRDHVARGDYDDTGVGEVE